MGKKSKRSRSWQETEGSPDSIPYEVKKTLSGARFVHYACPRCGQNLKSPLRDAGKDDACPECGFVYATPGTKELKRQLAEEEERARRAQELRDKRHEERLAVERAEELRKAEVQKVADQDTTLNSLLARHDRSAGDALAMAWLIITGIACFILSIVFFLLGADELRAPYVFRTDNAVAHTANLLTDVVGLLYICAGLLTLAAWSLLHIRLLLK